MKNIKPQLSKLYQDIKISSLRKAQQLYKERKDDVMAIDASIGNVKLPMHPAMINRLKNLSENPQFEKGIVPYPPTIGTDEANSAILKIIRSTGIDTHNLYSMITTGGSTAIDHAVLATCSKDKPLLIFEPFYPNYKNIAQGYSIDVVAITRQMDRDGKIIYPSKSKIEELIIKTKPAAFCVIPFDNPTGDMMKKEKFLEIAELCIKYNMWFISDEAYRTLYYKNEESPGIWKLDKLEGIKKRRISIETVSKGFNGCGLRIGALVTDNKELLTKCEAFAMSHICTNAIGQYIVGALTNVPMKDIQKWNEKNKKYYSQNINWVRSEFKRIAPKAIFTSIGSAIYSVIDLRDCVPNNFSADSFVTYCAKDGKISLKGKKYTLLVSPMSGFYSKTTPTVEKQIRISYVENKENMKLIPMLFVKLLENYLKKC